MASNFDVNFNRNRDGNSYDSWRAAAAGEEEDMRRRRWEALLDAAVMALQAYVENPREEGSMGGVRGDGVEKPAAPVLRSKRGRVVAVPKRYKDSILGAAEEVENPQRGKSPDAIVPGNKKQRQV